MLERVEREAPLEVKVPGDKSIAIRCLLLALLADGPCTLRGLPDSAIIHTALAAVKQLSAQAGGDVRVTRHLGVGLDANALNVVVVPPKHLRSNDGTPLVVHCGGSATLARLLLGLLTGAGVRARIEGSPMLSRRPMDRVMAPLAHWTQRATSTTAGIPVTLPIDLDGERFTASVQAISCVSSAQVRSALFFAAVAAQLPISVRSETPGRRHTEQLLSWLGMDVRDDDASSATHLVPYPVRAFDITIPADPSAAAFLHADAAWRGHRLLTPGLLVDSQRDGFLRTIAGMGVGINRSPSHADANAPHWKVADVVVDGKGTMAPLANWKVDVADLIDEVPLLAIFLAASPATCPAVLPGLGELRVKESDRLQRVADLLVAFGAAVHVDGDTLTIQNSCLANTSDTGDGQRPPVPVRTDGDHRLAMGALILGRWLHRDVQLDDDDAIGESWPEFPRQLEALQAAFAATAPAGPLRPSRPSTPKPSGATS